MSRATSVVLLGVAIAAGLGAWWIFGAEPRPPTTTAIPQDDLELVAALLDASPAESPRDALAVSPGAVYLARAADRTIVEVGARDAGAARVVARLDAPARSMVYADGALWVLSKRSVLRVPAAGGDVRSVAQLERPTSLACDGRWVFVVDVDAATPGLTHANAVVRVPVDGGEKAVLGRSEGEITNVALDESTVYWADRLEGSIVAVAKIGGAPRVLATERGLPGSIAVQGDTLTWVEKRSESLWSMPKAGDTPIRLAQDFAGFANLVVDARGAAWTNEAAVDGAFHVLTLGDGGEPVTASPAATSIDALASDGTHLYWARAGEVAGLR